MGAEPLPHPVGTAATAPGRRWALLRGLLFAYFVAAGVTWSWGGAGVFGRLAIADMLMLALLVWVLGGGGRAIRVSPPARVAFLLLLVLGFGILQTRHLKPALTEWLVHGFAMAGFVALYSVIVARDWEERLDVAVLWVRAASVLALFGILELSASLAGLPGLLDALGQPPITRSGLVGTFRNTGQAGVFFAVALTTAIPVLGATRGRRRLEMLLSTFFLFTALLLTVKRSALVGLGVGVGLLFILHPVWQRRRGWVGTAAVGTGLLAALFLWMARVSADFRERLEYKLGTEGIAVFFDFARENVEAARRAFAAHPVVGVGVGGVQNVWTPIHELHSSYLAVLAQGGVLGAIAYGVFAITLYFACTRSANGIPAAARIGRLYAPLLIGLAVSFAYTYHLRKREFWITAAIASALMAPDPRWRRAAGRQVPGDAADEENVILTAPPGGGLDR